MIFIYCIFLQILSIYCIFYRYLFEPDHSKYFPTICLEYGPIDLGIMWPEAAMGIPKFDEVSTMFVLHVYIKTCLKQPLPKRPKIGFQD